jgi:hypothetical protein
MIAWKFDCGHEKHMIMHERLEWMETLLWKVVQINPKKVPIYGLQSYEYKNLPNNF